MISTEKLIKMARKWQKLAAITRKRIEMPTNKGSGDASKVNKGHFVVYSADRRRFVIPLVYLENEVFRVLLKLAEEEYGLPRDGPITLPCNAIFMEYAVFLIQRRAAKDLEKALLMSISSVQCLSSSHIEQGQINQQLLICNF